MAFGSYTHFVDNFYTGRKNKNHTKSICKHLEERKQLYYCTIISWSLSSPRLFILKIPKSTVKAKEQRNTLARCLHLDCATVSLCSLPLSFSISVSRPYVVLPLEAFDSTCTSYTITTEKNNDSLKSFNMQSIHPIASAVPQMLFLKLCIWVQTVLWVISL